MPQFEIDNIRDTGINFSNEFFNKFLHLSLSLSPSRIKLVPRVRNGSASVYLSERSTPRGY